MADVTLLTLRVLREVGRLGSFSAAADALSYTQSAVSRQVAGAEQAFGAVLFERTVRGVRPTEAGAAVLAHAHRALDEIDSAHRALEDVQRGAAGRVRLGAFPTAMAELVPRALRALRDQRPGIEVVLREGTTPSQVRRVLGGRLDAAVVGSLPAAPARDPALTVRTLLEDPLLLAVSREHPLAAREAVDPEELAGERFIAGTADAASTFLEAWAGEGWEPQIGPTVREWTAKLGLVAAGLGVTVVPRLAAGAVRPDVALLRIRGEASRRTVMLVTRAGAAPEPAVTALCDALEVAAGALAASPARRGA